MYTQHSNAIEPFGHNAFHLYSSSAKAPVSIYKTNDTYEVMVFAPGRIKENFSVTVSGEELIIDYTPTDDVSSFECIRKEYSRGGFERTFLLDKTLDAEGISAKYEDGVLKLSVKIIP